MINLQFNCETIPDEMKPFSNWVCYSANKISIDAKTGHNAKANDPGTWTDFETAVRYADTYQLGVGFQFGTRTERSGITGIDIDKCRDPETGKLSDLQQK